MTPTERAAVAEAIREAISIHSSPTIDRGDGHGDRGQSGYIVWESSMPFVIASVVRALAPAPADQSDVHKEAAGIIDEIERGLDALPCRDWEYNAWPDETSAIIEISDKPEEMPGALFYMRGSDMCDEGVGEHIAHCSPSNLRTLIATYRTLGRERDEAVAALNRLRKDAKDRHDRIMEQ